MSYMRTLLGSAIIVFPLISSYWSKYSLWHFVFTRPGKKIAFCNSLKKFGVGRSVKKIFVIFLVKNVWFMHVIR